MITCDTVKQLCIEYSIIHSFCLYYWNSVSNRLSKDQCNNVKCYKPGTVLKEALSISLRLMARKEKNKKNNAILSKVYDINLI